MSDFKLFLHKFVYRIARAVVRPFLSARYGFRTDYVPDVGEPYILLSNHTTEDDMLFVGIAGRRHMYFVCGEHLLRNKTYGWALRSLIDPIPLPKGGASLSAVREILARIKAGHNVCMFPEGKRSFHGETIPSPVSLGKLVKKAGCALVTYRIRGGYFTYPRWARNNHRKGHVEGKVMGVYSSDQLAKMTPREITDLINRDTYENAFEVQRREMWPYKGHDLTKGLAHLLFMCPRCGGMDTIQTEGDSFSCTACGMTGTHNRYGFFEGEDLPFDNVHAWMRWIEPAFDRFVEGRDENEVLFTEPDVLLYHMLEDYRNEDITTDTLQVFRDRMAIGGFSFPFEEISYLSLLFGNILLFTHRGTYYGLTGPAFRAWKCARLWHLTQGDTKDPSKEI